LISLCLKFIFSVVFFCIASVRSSVFDIRRSLISGIVCNICTSIGIRLIVTILFVLNNIFMDYICNASIMILNLVFDVILTFSCVCCVISVVVSNCVVVKTEFFLCFLLIIS